MAAVGEVEVWRTRPGPEELLVRRVWRADLSLFIRAEPVAVRRPARWMAGPAVGMVDGRAGLGGALATPPVRLRRAKLRAIALVITGSSESSAAVALMAGW